MYQVKQTEINKRLLLVPLNSDEMNLLLKMLTLTPHLSINVCAAHLIAWGPCCLTAASAEQCGGMVAFVGHCLAAVM